MARRNQRWLPWAIGALVALVGICALLGWMGWRALRANPLVSDAQENLTAAQIESIGRIKLPPSAANVEARAGGFQDRFISIRFEMAPSELEQFLLGTPNMPAIAPATELPFQSLGEPPPWWRPEQAQRFAAGKSFVDGISQALVVDMTDAARFVVYIQTFET